MELFELLGLNLSFLMTAIQDIYNEPSKEELDRLLTEFTAAIPDSIRRMKISHDDLSDEIDTYEILTDNVAEMTI